MKIIAFLRMYFKDLWFLTKVFFNQLSLRKTTITVIQMERVFLNNKSCVKVAWTISPAYRNALSIDKRKRDDFFMVIKKFQGWLKKENKRVDKCEGQNYCAHCDER